MRKHLACGYVGDDFQMASKTEETSKGRSRITFLVCPQCNVQVPFEKVKEYNMSGQIEEVEPEQVDNDSLQEERGEAVKE